MLKKTLGLTALLAGAALGAGTPAEAAFTYSVTQSGPDVLVTGSGSANTTGLLPLFTAGCPTTGVHASTGYFGAGQGLCTAYGFIFGPATLGAGPVTFGSFGGGDAFHLNTEFHRLFLPVDYVSESLLSNSMTFANQTYATLGLSPGDYTWNWGSGLNADEATLRVVPVAVPEPAAPALFATALLGMALLRRRQARPSMEAAASRRRSRDHRP